MENTAPFNGYQESSVVAAASKSAKFWSTRGGFKATVINTEKIGQVHFLYKGDVSKLELFLLKTKQNSFPQKALQCKKKGAEF
jgi:hydroxymethylglutaryl-CoA reductase